MAAINDVFTFVQYTNIYHIDDYEALDNDDKYQPKINVRTYMEGALPSKVGIGGKMELNEQARKSKSIRDKFVLIDFPEIKSMFDKYKIGIGSKHVYNVGDFMKPHYDSKRPDIQVQDGKKTITLPHVMTIVVLYNHGDYEGGELIINDKQVVIYDKATDYWAGEDKEKAIVMFGLGCKHEVTPVTQGGRITFTFPVYGIYNYVDKMIDSVKVEKPINIYDCILKLIDEAEKDGLANSSAEFHGFIRALNDYAANKYAVQLRKIYEGFVPREFESDYDGDYEEECENIIVEYDLDDEHYCENLHNHFNVPAGAKNVLIHRSSKSSTILKKLKDRVLDLKKEAEEREKVAKETKNDCYPFNSTFTTDFNSGTNPIYILLKNRYKVGSTMADLAPNDKELYDYLTANGMRTTIFVPMAKKPDKYSGAYNVYEYTINGKIRKMENDRYDYRHEKSATPLVSSFNIEFDDQGSYGPDFDNVYGLFLVK